MKRQEQETVTSVESKQYRRAMANLPNDNKEALCGICGDAPVILNSAYKCATCAAPVCQKCFERVMRFEKIKWKWTHASAAKNLCFHPRHPDCYTRASMKIIRDTTSRNIQCEVCEHRQMKAEEREEEEEERPSTQPPSPEPCSIRFRCGNEQPPSPKPTRFICGTCAPPVLCAVCPDKKPLDQCKEYGHGFYTERWLERQRHQENPKPLDEEEEEDEFEGHDWSDNEEEKEEPKTFEEQHNDSWQDQTRCVK